MRTFFKEIVEPNTEYRLDESYPIETCGSPIFGESFSFNFSFYNQLNKDITDKLGLKERL